jgi:hypothetical protein
MKYSRRSKTRKLQRKTRRKLQRKSRRKLQRKTRRKLQRKPRRKLKRKTRRKLKRNTRSKRRRRKQLVKRQQKGGMFINLSPANVARFRKNPHTLTKDCCPCVFHFFGMPLHLVEDLKKKFGETGMQAQHIINVFKKAYPTTRKGRTSWEWYGSAPRPYLPSPAASAAVLPFIIHIYKELALGQGIIGVTDWSGEGRAGSHCVIFAKDASGTPLLIDAQHPTMSAFGEEAIIKYIKDQHVWSVSVLSGKDAEGQRITIDSSGNIL